MSTSMSPFIDERFRASYERIADAYRQRPVSQPPVLVVDCNYWITGEDPAAIPDDYFAEGGFGSMLDFQRRKIDSHLERLPDDYIPFLFPWYGTGVVPSALGSNIVFQRGEEPAVEGPVITEPAEIRRLVPPDPTKDGLMPRVLRCIDYMRAHSSLPVSFTDCQGPFNIALNLLGVERICTWMYEEQEAVHELMDFCTTVLIDWLKVQKEHAGQALESGAFPHAIVLPEGFGGVWISDDDCTIISPALYREFVVPYNSRVLKAFGGGTLHYCGSAPHQLENFLATDGLVGINNWCMGDFDQVRRAKELFRDRLVFMVCDYTPLDPESYFRELFYFLDPKGSIVATYPAATNALDHRKRLTVSVKQDPQDVADRVWQILQGILGQRRREAR
jgi:hypothetical protein